MNRIEGNNLERKLDARRGATAVLAMLYLVLFATLTLSMYTLSVTSVQSADNLADAERAHEAAESGLRWIEHRFANMTRPKTRSGTITDSVADTLWPQVCVNLEDELDGMLKTAERPVTYDDAAIITAPISIDEGPGRFVITARPDAADKKIIIVESRGTYGDATRTISMRFVMEKKIRHAVISRVPIQLGRNTLIDGPLAMVTPGKYPPVYSLSDFKELTPNLKSRIGAFETWLKANHSGYDGRVSAGNPPEFAAAQSAGFKDLSADGWIDEYDLFLGEFDKDKDKGVSLSEFTNPTTGKPYDEDLFHIIDNLNGPTAADDEARDGYNDGIIDNRDGYAKVRGKLNLAASEAGWKANLGGGKIQDQIHGPVVTEFGEKGVDFSVPISAGAGAYGLTPQDFDTSGFKAETLQGALNHVPGVKVENGVVTADFANGGTADEKTPHQSSSFQATYKRPVFKNMTFVNCRFPKGLNALFENCKFEGVTYVELQTNVTSGSTTTTDPGAGMTWAKRMKSGSFSASTPLTKDNSHGFNEGNNLRFNDCTFHGPLATDVPSAYTHFANSWEFTGKTLFDNTVDQTATLVAPQTNIEMGSFEAPAAAPSTLVGVVVAGNIDIRGESVVDGSIIVTGTGAGNTTLGWFGPSDAATVPSGEMPEGGWGRILVRYNKNRTLPDGINMAIDIVPQVHTYQEGAR